MEKADRNGAFLAAEVLQHRYPSNLLARLEPGDFCALEAQSGHDSPLIKEKGADTLLKGGCRSRCGKALIHHHEGGSGAELKSIAFLKILQGGFIQEKQGVAEFLNPGLIPVRCRGRVVVAVNLTILEEHTVSALDTDQKPGLDDFRKNQNSNSLFTESLCFGILLDQVP